TTDGRYVWTVVAEGDNGIVTGPVRVAVLDAVDGQVLASEPLLDDFQVDQFLAHPDGRHVAIIGAREGEEGPYWSTIYWGSVDAETCRLRITPFPSRSDIITGLDPSGHLVAMTDIDGTYLSLRRFNDGTVVATVLPRAEGQPQRPEPTHTGNDRFAPYTGFLDQHMMLASYGPDAKTGYTHWLINVPAQAGDLPIDDILGGRLSRPVCYPATGPDALLPHVWALGDGTWLTADTESLYRWSLT